MGVGRALIYWLEERLRRLRAQWLRLEVAVDNHPALAFYGKLGFEPVGRLRGYYSGNLDAFLMHKTLGGEEHIRNNPVGNK